VGLDLVELAMSVEDEFDIAISDAVLETIETPQDYANYIFEVYQEKDSLKCSSQVGFYKIRKIFIEVFNCKREELRPDTDIEILFKDNIKENWIKLNKLLDKRVCYPLELRDLYLVLVFFISLISGIILKSIFLFFLIWSFLFIVFKYFLASKIPKSVRRLSSLIRFVDESNAMSRYKTKEVILKKIIEISIYELGLSEAGIVPTSKYVEDLGVD